MADKEAKSTMRKFMTSDQANYYSGITSITVNGKNAYELKEKFFDDLHNNAFSKTSMEDAAEHIEYFLGIVDPIDLSNINQDKLRVIVLPISLVGDARRCYLLKIDLDVLSKDIEGFKTYDEYKDDWIYEWNKDVPWTYDEYKDDWNKICHGYTKNYGLTLEYGLNLLKLCIVVNPFHYKYGCSEWPTCNWREDGYCNEGNLPGAYIDGNTLCYQDLDWYDALKDSKLKKEALKNKAIMEGIIDDNDKLSDDGWKRWDGYEITNHDQEKRKNVNEHEEEERCEVFNDHERPVCNIRRFEMIKYSFGLDEEYVDVKEDEYDDLTSTSKDACQAYQEIFCMMDEG
nr:hypothetical protein [Tanacetum cinerariifolium]